MGKDGCGRLRTVRFAELSCVQVVHGDCLNLDMRTERTDRTVPPSLFAYSKSISEGEEAEKVLTNRYYLLSELSELSEGYLNYYQSIPARRTVPHPFFPVFALLFAPPFTHETPGLRNLFPLL